MNPALPEWIESERKGRVNPALPKKMAMVDNVIMKSEVSAKDKDKNYIVKKGRAG